MHVVLRRLCLWTVLCTASAAPSFYFGWFEHNWVAMVVGVLLFIGAYTAATSTSAFARFHRRPFVRRTLYFGYGIRLLLSLMFPLAFAVEQGLMLIPDVWPGLLSINIVENYVGLDAKSFVGTLATTIIQGTLLNSAIFVLMLATYGVQRLFLTPPPESAPQGFEVVMPTAADARM